MPSPQDDPHAEPRSGTVRLGYAAGVRWEGEDTTDAEPDVEALVPLARPWERRAGLERRAVGDPRPQDDAVLRWVPRPVGDRVVGARALARETGRRTVGTARLVRDVADGVRDEAERVTQDAAERARAAAAAVRARRGRPTILVGTTVVLAVCTLLLVLARPWEPSAGARGEVAWAAAVLAVGLAAGRAGTPVTTVFRAVLLPAALLAVLAPLSRAASPFAWAMLAIPLLGAGGAVAIGLTAGAARRTVERFPGVAPLLPRAAVGAATLAVLVAAWGVRADLRTVERTPADPLTLSDRTGAFRGIDLRSRPSEVRARLGAPVIAARGGHAAGHPLDADDELALPAELPTGETWRYEGLALVVSGGRLRAMIVTDDRAQANTGAGIGDGLDVVRRAYGGLACHGVRHGDARNPAYPACRSRLPGRAGLRRVRITFVGDPVQSVVLERGATGPLLEGGDPR